MNSDTLAGDWNQLSGKIMKQWGKLTDDNLARIKGSRRELVGTIQKTYGLAREEAEEQVKAWEKSSAA